jgi:hypothetical protein
LKIVLVVLLSAATIFAVGSYLRLSFNAYIKDEPTPLLELPPEIESGWRDRVHDLATDKNLSIDQVLAFAGCIVTPRAYFVRISEHVEPYHRSTMVRSVYTMRLTEIFAEEDPGSETRSDTDYVLPLFLPTKTTLHDGIKAFDTTGKRISTLDSHAQNLFSAAAIRFMIETAGSLKSYDADDGKLERRVWELLTDSDPAEQSIREVTDSILNSGAGADKHYIGAAVELIRELAQFRPISIVQSAEDIRKMRWPATLRYTLERRFVGPLAAPMAAPKIRNSTLLDSVRLGLGVKLNRLYFPIVSAYRSSSYHLEVEGPDGTFFAGEELITGDSSQVSQLRASGITTQSRMGQRRSHLYLREFSGERGALFGVRFFERAPTSFSGITIAAFVSTALISVLTFLNTTPPIVGSPDRLGSIIPALLALPIAVSAFMGLEPNGGKRHPSLASRGVSLFIALLSLAAFVLSVTDERAVDVPDIVWHALLWTSIGTSVAAACSWIVRLSVETHFTRSTKDEKIS